MKRLLNVLYVTSDGAYLKRDGESVVVKVENEIRLRIPIHTLEGIVCFGRTSVSPWLVGMCGEKGVALTFLSTYGKFLGRMQGPVSGNVLLRRGQYRLADSPDRVQGIVQAIVAAKVANSRSVVLRAKRETGVPEQQSKLQSAADNLKRILRRIRDGGSVDTLRGFEGEAGRTYFGVFDSLILEKDKGFVFNRRSRRPPLDPVNALLSFLYTLIRSDVQSALETVGLDPAVGFLHKERPGRPSLALDLMEEFRPLLGDRLVLTLINRGQVKSKHFKSVEDGGVWMNDDTRKAVLVAYQERKQDEVLHPFLNERIPLGMVPHIQAQLMARHIRGNLESYPPYFWK